MTDETRGAEHLDARSPELLSRLMLDSVVTGDLNDGQAIALGVAYSNLALAEAQKTLAAAIREHAEVMDRRI